MDFRETLKTLVKEFKESDIRYALIGGFAVGILGVPRATLDLDFLILNEQWPQVDTIMKELGYECRHKSEDVSQYVSAVKLFGEVDFIHAFRKVSKSMLARAIEKEAFGGELKICVLKPEDIIGLKLQALANDPQRENREYADIEALLESCRATLDWPLLAEYFSLFEQEEAFNKFKARFYGTEQ
ncbi:MAG: nucleotidyltransferase [Candidatus Omnitrophica bacterium]|nr:nucleotidyltransferase [Candidatus Omnitrophota bacterium]